MVGFNESVKVSVANEIVDEAKKDEKITHIFLR